MQSSLYWLTQSITALPLFALVYLVSGIPAALLLLPRRDWRSIPLVLCLAFIAGPTLLTLWMFILGTIGGAQKTALLTPASIMAGLIVITGICVALAWRKYRREPAPEASPRVPLAFDEKLLILILFVAIGIRFITTAYWPFTTYDTLWVYGYEGRLYALQGFIPTTIGYYPQFLSLQYAFAQIMVGGIDDHAARMAIPFLHAGSLLAAYVLGAKLFNRRTGFAALALWGLYPHVSAWAHQGDLEIPLAFVFTAAAAFFLMAWTARPGDYRRRYALIAGLCLGVALWTKPTAGAFIWGVMLLVAFEAVRVVFHRAHLPQFIQRFETAAITGLACLPVGAVWYIRNILLGHAPVDLPHVSWLARATRSGDVFGWLLLALILLLILLVITRIRPLFGYGTKNGKPGYVSLLIYAAGLLLVLAGTLPSMPWVTPARLDPPLSYITLPEAALIIVGCVVLVLAGYRLMRAWWSPELETIITRMAWALLLALPYFITWFYSYSYHYRLSFAIVPLLILPSAVILARLMPEFRRLGDAPHRPYIFVLKAAYAVVIIAISVPGLIASITDAAREKDWLWTDRYPDDTARYREHAPEMILVRDALQGYMNTTGKEPVVVSPGEQRLQFFFPLMTIITNTVPTRLDELEGATHYIYGSQPSWRYQDEGLPEDQNQIVAAMGRSDVMYDKMYFDEGIFRYEVYELHLENRQQPSKDVIPFDDEIIYDGKIRLTGYSVNNTNLSGNKIFISVQLEVLEKPDQDYTLQLQLVNLGDGKVYHAADTCVMPGRHGCYRSTLWDKGELIYHQSVLMQEADGAKMASGQYALIIGLYTQDADGTPHYLPVTVNGKSVPDFRLDGFKTAG